MSLFSQVDKALVACAGGIVDVQIDEAWSEAMLFASFSAVFSGGSAVRIVGGYGS